eukprot:3686606-Pleurochrysis_carterae.AAC.1
MLARVHCDHESMRYLSALPFKGLGVRTHAIRALHARRRSAVHSCAIGHCVPRVCTYACLRSASALRARCGQNVRAVIDAVHVRRDLPFGRR